MNADQSENRRWESNQLAMREQVFEDVVKSCANAVVEVSEAVMALCIH